MLAADQVRGAVIEDSRSGRHSRRAGSASTALMIRTVPPISHGAERPSHPASRPPSNACDVRLPSGLIVVSQQVCRSGPLVPGACERPDRGVRRQPASPSAEVGRDRPGSGIHNLVTVGTLQRHGQGFSQRRAGARPGRDHRWFASHTNDGYG